jgi:hypothetical protein
MENKSENNAQYMLLFLLWNVAQDEKEMHALSRESIILMMQTSGVMEVRARDPQLVALIIFSKK